MAQPTNTLAVISEQELRRRAPAIFARKGDRKMSAKYVPIPTVDVIKVLAKEGFVPTAAKQDRVAKRDPRFCRHMVHLTHRRHLKKRIEGAPQIVLTGSANGTKPLELRLGYFRLICTNGLIVCSGELDRFVTKHIYVEPKDVINRARELSKAGAQLVKRVERWGKVRLSEPRQLAFAREALTLRFGDLAKQYDPRALLTAQREADEGPSLWKVLNRVQENATHGNFVGERKTKGKVRKVRARALKGITNDVNVNEALWALAEKYAQKARA